MNAREGLHRRTWRALHVLGVPAAVVLGLSACSPVYDGITGISRDDQGRLVGLWQGCEQKQVGATLLRDDNSSDSVQIGEWVARSPSLHSSFSLQPAAAPRGWSTYQPGPETFELGHRYTLIAWVELNETNSIPVEFTSRDLDKVVKGSVLIEVNGGERVRLVSLDEFSKGGCRYK